VAIVASGAIQARKNYIKFTFFKCRYKKMACHKLIWRNIRSVLINNKAFLSRQPATIAKGDVIVPEYRLTTLPSGFRVASENLEMPTATVNLSTQLYVHT
jgi:hypothetical protein